MSQETDQIIELGNRAFIEGNLEGALRYYRKALCIDRCCAVAYYNIANILAIQSRFDPAERHYRQALEITPHWPEALNNLANVLKELGKNSEAMKLYQDALTINPLLSEAHNGLGSVYQSEGMIDRAIFHYRKALEINPDYAVAHSNLLLALNYSADYSPAQVFNEHKRYAKSFESSPTKGSLRPCGAKRLKIGYVSPDFRRHSVGYFIEPLLECHDRAAFEVFCYSDVTAPDAITERLRSYVEHWFDTHLLTDPELYDLISGHRLDILIDLAGHSGYNRLGVFAKRAAPIQITYLGYPNTTGLKSMDYRIVDVFTDPEGLTDHYYSEQLIRMRQCFLCYAPPNDAPDVGPPSFVNNGYITFGSLNNLAKLNDLTLDIWAKVLLETRDSRLLIKSKALNDNNVKERLMERFKKRGIAPERLELIGFIKAQRAHLETYNLIDIALDPYPYNGTTTTFEALYMGVPVVTLAGNTHASRVGLSILSNLGLEELVASNSGEFIVKAVGISQDKDRLKLLRSSLRRRILDSHLTDKRGFTREIETLLQSACL